MSVFNNPLLIGSGDYQISRSVRLRSSASAYLSRTFGSPTSNILWTLSWWMKKSTTGQASGGGTGDCGIIASNNSGNFDGLALFNGDDKFSFRINSVEVAKWSAVQRDPSAWGHYVLIYDSANATQANRLRLYQNGVQLTAMDVAVALTSSQTSKINSAQQQMIGPGAVAPGRFFDGYLTEVNFIDCQALTPSSFGQISATTGIWSPIKYGGTYGTNGFYLNFSDNSSTTALGYDFNNQGAAGASFTTGGTALSSSDDASYPKANAFDGITTNANAWRSGELSPGVSGVSYIGYDCGSGVTKSPAKLRIMQGRIDAAGNGALTSAKLQYSSNGSTWTDLQTLTLDATSGTETTWQVFTISGASAYRYWRLLANSNASGTGQRWAVTELEFLEAGQCGFNRWTPNNISVTAGATYDSMLDVPTPYADGGNGRGNYAVLNPLPGSTFTTYTTLSEGNLKATGNNTGVDVPAAGTIFVNSGKWYFEAMITVLGANPGAVGITSSPTDTNALGNGGGTVSYGYVATGNKRSSAGTVAYGASYTTNDVIGIALDMDGGTVTFYKNNVSQGTAFTGLSGYYTFAVGTFGSGSMTANFGQRPFSYTPPSGYSALNTQNLPTPTILKGNQYMDATTYTGNGSTQSLTNSGSFQPDLVWVKSRSNALDHKLTDSVRGVTKGLISDTTGAETTDTNGVTAFNAGGFSLGSDSNYNTNAYTYVGWQWKAGGAAVTNTSGSITSQVSSSPTAGFSVVTYTGTGANATVGHGLGVAPKYIIVKKRGSGGAGTYGWYQYHASLTSAAYSILFDTAAQSNTPTMWNSTAPSSTVFTVGTSNGSNENTQNYLAYCFAEVSGFSKFGSYTGNGSADGPFVFTGFRPRFVMIKRTDSTGSWRMLDTSRSSYNVSINEVLADSSAAEITNGISIDILSGGFKSRDASLQANASGGTYIYAAFAENPFKYSLAR